MIHRFATPSGLGFSGVGLGVWAYRVYIYIYTHIGFAGLFGSIGFIGFGV